MPTSYFFTRSLSKTPLESVLQANTSCLHLLNRVFRLLRSTRDWFWVLNTLAMPLAFLLPMIYFAHTHTHWTPPTSSVPVYTAPASHSNWNGARGQERRNLDQWFHLDLWTISLLRSSSMPVYTWNCQCHKENNKCSTPDAWPLQAPEWATPLPSSETLSLGDTDIPCGFLQPFLQYGFWILKELFLEAAKKPDLIL